MCDHLSAVPTPNTLSVLHFREREREHSRRNSCAGRMEDDAAMEVDTAAGGVAKVTSPVRRMLLVSAGASHSIALLGEDFWSMDFYSIWFIF